MILFCGLAANARNSVFRRFAVTVFSGVLLLLGGTSAFAAATFSFTTIYDQTIGKSTVLEMNIDLTVISTNPSELNISVRSSNSKLISPDNITFSEVGGILNLILRPVDCTTGASIIELTATDSKATNRSSFIVTVASRGNPIGLGSIDDRMIVEGQPLDVFFILWLWLDKCSGNVDISANCSNRQLFPNANLTLEGSSTNWHLHWVPEPGMTGQAIMNVVAGVDGYQVSSGFVVTVGRSNAFPVISYISNQVVTPNVPALVGFTASATSGDPTNLAVTVESMELSRFPNENLRLDSNGTNYTLTLTLATNAPSGNAGIRVRAIDPFGTFSEADFLVKIPNAQDLPELSWSRVTQNLRITLDVPSGPTRLETSTDLKTWVPASPGTETNASIVFDNSINETRRYYRAVRDL